ncbi:MAG: ribonuclease P protein component [Candidatus Ryanbacteria bacterium]|nr:ribonuclease P protein component [Candidatus Ryanbacteria bacterium]
MLSRAQRLHSASDIKQVLRKGRKLEDRALTVWILMGLKESRATVIVPRAFDKRAVARNTAKRRIREALKLVLSVLPRGSQIIVRPKAGAGTLSSVELKHTLCDILRIS